MKGSGLLLLWNDIDPWVETQYNRWHSREHVPERVSVPGILAGRRYARVGEEVHCEGAQRYLSVYELESTAVLSSRPYLALVDSPTPCSRKMRPHFRNLARAGLRRIASAGSGAGAWLLVLRVAGGRPDQAARAAALQDIVALEGIVAAHWGEVDAGVPGIAWNAGGAPPPAFDEGVLAEATGPDALADARFRIDEIVRTAAHTDSVEGGPAYALLHRVESHA